MAPGTADGPTRGAGLLRLQRCYGNYHVQRLVEQGEFRVGRAAGRAERDADRRARRVAGTTPPRPDAAVTGPLDLGIDVDTERAIRGARGGGRPLPGWVRGAMEQRLGASFDEVRLHTDARADQVSRSLDSLACTAGNDIFFRRGGYTPGSAAGRYLLAHELTHVAQQRSGTGPPVVQRYIASVNHQLRDPKASLKDDYGTYRSLDVALAAGGGRVFKGPNTAEKGGRLDQLTKDRQGIMLDEAEDLYLVGHGSQNLIGVMGAGQVAAAVANITPGGWKGRIFSLNCWSGFGGDKSALAKLHQSLAKMGKPVSVSGPVGRSFRHKDWLSERDSPLGMRAVAGELTKNEEQDYKRILEESRAWPDKTKEPEDAFDEALAEAFKDKIANREPIGVEKKAEFATEWGRKYQENVVRKLEKDERVRAAIDEKRVLFGRAGLYEKGAGLDERIVSTARSLNSGEQQIVALGRGEDRPQELKQPEEPVRTQEPVRTPDVGRGDSWSWLEMAGVGLVGLLALGAGIVLLRRR